MQNIIFVMNWNYKPFIVVMWWILKYHNIEPNAVQTDAQEAVQIYAIQFTDSHTRRLLYVYLRYQPIMLIYTYICMQYIYNYAINVSMSLQGVELLVNLCVAMDPANCHFTTQFPYPERPNQANASHKHKHRQPFTKLPLGPMKVNRMPRHLNAGNEEASSLEADNDPGRSYSNKDSHQSSRDAFTSTTSDFMDSSSFTGNPLQVGGLSHRPINRQLFGWSGQEQHFEGCIRNIRINGEVGNVPLRWV